MGYIDNLLNDTGVDVVALESEMEIEDSDVVSGGYEADDDDDDIEDTDSLLDDIDDEDLFDVDDDDEEDF